MDYKTLIAFLLILLLILCACSTTQRVDGWYRVADYPDNSIIGKPLRKVDDFDCVEIVRDTFIIEGTPESRLSIQGRVKPDRRLQWADDTERLIGHRLGFVHNDSIITAPQINARIESGTFQINSSDTTLIKEIFLSIENR